MYLHLSNDECNRTVGVFFMEITKSATDVFSKDGMHTGVKMVAVSSVVEY